MPVQYQKLSILVADDFSSFRSSVNSMLLGLGVIKVEMASNGEGVLEKCAKQKFDVILCDYDLGAGRNGQHVLEELRFRGLIDWRTTFIIVSAEASRNIVMSTYDCEPDDYLMKPISTRMLERRMARLVDLKAKLKPVYTAIANGDRQFAIDILIDISIADDRYSVPAQKILGELFIDNGDYNKAEKLYTKTLEVRQLDWARLGLAKVKQKQGELETASKWLHRIVEDNPLYLPAYDVLADNWEELGNSTESQSTIKKAVDVSPMSILRQKRLANVAQVNGDTETALHAMKKCVLLGQYSCHGTSQDSVNFARLAINAVSQGLVLPENILDDAIGYMEEAQKKYGFSDSELKDFENTKNTIESLETGSLTRGDIVVESNEQAEDEIETGDSDSIFTEFDIKEDVKSVKWLLKNDQKEEAQHLLQELQERYQNDEHALQMLDEFFNEPVSESNQNLVSTVNREGIGLYSEGRYDDALRFFEKARKLFPKHIGIQLNIAQCLIGKLKEHGDDEDSIVLCEAALNVVSEVIEPKHSQFDRFSKLKKLATATIGRSLNISGVQYD